MISLVISIVLKHNRDSNDQCAIWKGRDIYVSCTRFSISEDCSHISLVQEFTKEAQRTKAYKTYFELSKECPKHGRFKM